MAASADHFFRLYIEPELSLPLEVGSDPIMSDVPLKGVQE